MRALPTGWAFGTVADTVAPEPGSLTDGPFGSNLKTEHYTEAGPRVVRLQNIGDGRFLDNPAHISDGRFERLRRHEAKPGDVVVAMLGEEVPRACLVPPTLGPAIVKADCARLRVDRDRFDGAFVMQALNAHQTRRAAAEQVHGMGRPRLGLGLLRDLRLPIAPLPEQRRIVDALDSYLTRLDAAGASLRRVEVNLERYRASVLQAAVEGRVVPTEAELARSEGRDYEPASVLLERILRERRRRWEEEELARGRSKARYQEPAAPDTSSLPELPEGWCWATVEQLESGDRRCGYGVLVPGPDLPDGVPLVRVGDLSNGRIEANGLKRISKTIADRFSRTYVRGGEVLLSVVGTIGRTAVVPSTLVGANVARAIAVLPVATGLAPSWVELWLRSPQMKARTCALAHEVARKTLNIEDVRRACVAIPPLSEQLRIRERLDDLESLIEADEGVIKTSADRLSRLRQSILSWAFQGKLVDQDPADEPASVLLERIRAERQRSGGARRRGRGRRSRQVEAPSDDGVPGHAEATESPA